jgi:hypothetical protein
MKVRIGFGPPPRDLLTTSRIARGMEVWKTPHRRAELWLPQGLCLDDLDDENADFLAFTKYEKRDQWHFGGSIKRRVSVTKAHPEIDNETICHHSWEEILGPTLPWEAWRSCVEWKMELQGIELEVRDGCWRLFFHGPGVRGRDFCLQFFDQNVDEVEDRSEKLRKSYELMFWSETGPDDPILVEWPKIYSTPTVDPTMIRWALALHSLIPPGIGPGWRVAGIWRQGQELLERQAALFDMTTNQLLRRLERRKRASERKG